MFSYYGAKTRVIDLYPKPIYNKIIEPFAGSARYSLKYFDNDIILIDKYEVVVKIWKWLQLCTPADILKLPIMKEGESVNNYKFDCDEAKWLMGFIIGAGSERPKVTAGKRKTTMRPKHIASSLKRISENLYKIRHWQIVCGDYKDVLNQLATWYIDPPYEVGGYKYVCSGKKLNYNDLREWSTGRDGQVIICENTNAKWIDITPLGKNWGSTKETTEGIWTNIKEKQIQTKLCM